MALKRYKPFSPISEKQRAKKKQQSGRYILDSEFYQEIWEERNGICEITGQSLGTEPLSTMFHHLLPKAKYPQFRYCKWNIMMVKPEIHQQIEQDIDKVPAAKKKFEELMALVVFVL
ncbi:hypothetical protein SAMN05428988_3238 [Chitinophaga sp. YR573]|uniref:hypothetical protein n=1 Tax=Chitinophaga sp. YR573 TaxID=1881040 RepID=UPI0008D7C43B|nr:hypothetical protein [Chitinophaga sp. YR573]SEW21694.1 hypothetical protein SAMN05428988_3238 [Chitinophaga sp. YR573]